MTYQCGKCCEKLSAQCRLKMFVGVYQIKYPFCSVLLNLKAVEFKLGSAMKLVVMSVLGVDGKLRTVAASQLP